MSGILQSRKADNLKARMAELTDAIERGEHPGLVINRAFEAGVAAHSDHMEASRQMMLTKYREQPEPVAFMDVEPGSMLTLLRKEGE